MPTLLLGAEHDRVASAEAMADMAAALPRARFRLPAGAYHLVPLLEPGRVAEALGISIE
ncbi:alpha/beta fold hydrolase [Streptomyces lichenis]|uniref:Alpha/beta hydrolase n=1 Tax=Streptomyces lichenis TaxID=2306967 RepID=A0ABT0I7C7_9ACTN|nr:hypothetical protein [Streptomyces lichenis]MCK8677231.1 hypothetical protein [Streptomyces lichenis]